MTKNQQCCSFSCW